MAVSIHPYKGYLNTKFRVYANGDKPINYTVYFKEDDELGNPVHQGIVAPNEPHELSLYKAGVYCIQFKDGSKKEVIVEDGYKYGGNKLKNAFVFDNCPWVFIIMHDRTYFYNRDTRLAYVEPIAPDEVVEVSSDFVLLKNRCHKEQTLFSLERQEPVLWVDNVVLYTNKVLCWKDFNDDESESGKPSTIVLYSLFEQRIVTRVICDKFFFDKKCNALFYYSDIHVHRIDLDTLNDTIVYQYNEWESFVTFVGSHYAVSYAASQSKLYILDIQNLEARGEVVVQGTLARVNDVTFINIRQRVNDFRNFDFEEFSIPEALLQAQYTEIDLYPCDWDVEEYSRSKYRTFYAEKVTAINVSQGKYRNNFSRTESTNIKCIETDFIQKINNISGTVSSNENFFHFFNNRESLVIPRPYPNHISYYENKQIIQVGNTVIMKSDDEVRILTNRGFWDGHLSGKFDISYLNSFKVLQNENTRAYYNLSGLALGEFRGYWSNTPRLLMIGDYTIYPGGEFVASSASPQFISPNCRYGLSVTEAGVTLFEIEYHQVNKTSQILQEIYDTNCYTNVLFSENGQQIIYRDNEQAKMLELKTGSIVEFDNLSYINHINGIRPFIRVLETSQAILINPVDGQPVDSDLVSEYQFVSPDYQLYADKALSKYIEYYNLITHEYLSIDEYLQLHSKFNGGGNIEKQNRIEFISLHYDLLEKQLKKRCAYYNNKPKNEIVEALANNGFRCSFTGLFIEIRGVAVIKRIPDNVEVARIPLGPPLWFLNYVSFSKDSRYVAIAGRYPDESIYSGLFLVYDLVKQKTIIDNKSSYAVWTTAFTKDNIVAAYTSSPNSYVGSCVAPNVFTGGDGKFDRDKGFNVRNYNFLTFSPNGEYFACSQQGYIRYRMPDGAKRIIWGHQPSSLVSIRNTEKPNVELFVYNDLDEDGIADTHCGASVASVSFSNDNSRIMIVGRNGVVVVRNIQL